MADAAEAFGRIDVQFNNAAAPRFAPVPEMSDEQWHYTIRSELDLIFFVTPAAWPHLIASGGVMVNTSSVQALVGIAMNGGIAHATAKAGVIAMTRQMAAESAPHGIRANCISLGTVATPATTKLFANEDMLSAVLAPLLIKCLGQPADVAAQALFLASDESSYIAGGNFVFDGGLTAD